jgi:hypothetical protein
MATSLDEPIEFLGIAASKGFLNDNTVQARRTACSKFFDILDPDQKTVEYVLENLDVIKARFSNLNKDVAGTTVNEYGRRVKLVLEDFTAWKADRAGWERSVSAKQSARPAADGEKKAKAKTEKPKAQPQQQTASGNGAAHQAPPNPDTRTVTFPIRPDFDLSVTLPRAGISVDELKRLVYFLLPYAQDWEPSQSPRSVFPMLERDDRE